MTIFDYIYQMIQEDVFGNHSVPSIYMVDVFEPVVFWFFVFMLLAMMFKMTWIVIQFVITLGGRY